MGSRSRASPRTDFQVLEDGRPAEVTEVTPRSSRPLALAVFFDSTSLDGSSRTAALRALGGFLAGLSPGDRVIFAGFDGSLTIRSETFGDPQALTTALEGFGKLMSRGAMAAQERAAVLREIREAPSVAEEQASSGAVAQASNVLARLREYIQTRAGETRAALGGLQQTLEVLAGFPGRRTLLYVGGGLPMRPGAGLYSAWENRFSIVAVELAASSLDVSRNDATPLVREVADRAAATGSTFFALALSDAGGAAESAEPVRGPRLRGLDTLPADPRRPHGRPGDSGIVQPRGVAGGDRAGPRRGLHGGLRPAARARRRAAPHPGHGPRRRPRRPGAAGAGPHGSRSSRSPGGP